MKVRELIETMKNSIVLESPKLIIKNDRKYIKHISIRLSEEHYYKYASREVISWDLCLTKINLKDSKIHGYLIIEVENE